MMTVCLKDNPNPLHVTIYVKKGIDGLDFFRHYEDVLESFNRSSKRLSKRTGELGFYFQLKQGNINIAMNNVISVISYYRDAELNEIDISPYDLVYKNEKSEVM